MNSFASTHAHGLSAFALTLAHIDSPDGIDTQGRVLAGVRSLHCAPRTVGTQRHYCMTPPHRAPAVGVARCSMVNLPTMPRPRQQAAQSIGKLTRSGCAGQLDQRQPEALQIMSGFGATFRRRSPSSIVSELKSAFNHVHLLPVCRVASTAPCASQEKHQEVMQLVCDGFRMGKFGKGPRRYGVLSGPEWEARLRALMADADVSRFLNGFAVPLDDIAVDLKAAVDRTLAAEAEATLPPASAGAPKVQISSVAAQPARAIQAKLDRCEYVAIGGFSRSAVADAFAQAQAGADGDSEQSSRKYGAKNELHVTLWHRAEGEPGRGLACVAAEGASVDFIITGFDVTPNLSAARVVFANDSSAGNARGAADGHVGDDVVNVDLPHITMHVGRGAKAVNARWLQQRHERGEDSVRWLPLPEPMRLTGKIHIVYKRK